MRRSWQTLASVGPFIVLAACGGQPGPSSEHVGTSGTDPSNTDPTSTDSADDSTANDSTAHGTLDGATAAEESGEPPQTTGDDFPAPELDDCVTSGEPGEHVFTCDGLAYDVSVPPQCLDQACGLIIDVHGRTMSGAMQDNNTGLRALGVERGYIVVQPNANGAPPLSSWVAEPDDDQVYDFILRTMAAFHTDPDRVHMTGFSQGGFMTWRMACDHAELFASVAPAAACGAEVGNEDCLFEPGHQPSQPLPILYLHGTTDAQMTYACAEPRRDAVLQTFGLSDPETISDDEHHQWVRYTDGAGMVFEYLTHDYENPNGFLVGHCFPGADDPGGESGQLFPFSCTDASAFVWGEAVIDFFDAHPR